MAPGETSIGYEFCLLMPVWAGDNPEHFLAAIESATIWQSLKPNQIVIVVDGSIPAELEEVIFRVEQGEFGDSKVLRLKQNSGLTGALEAGLKACNFDVVARADADDINLPDRFAKQIPYLVDNCLQILGSQMRELKSGDQPGKASGPMRQRPLGEAEIKQYLANHSPFHHPTVVYSKAAVKQAGGYRQIELMEDYELWNRMLANGSRGRNLPEVLVEYRVTEGLFKRRGGLRLFRSDLKMQAALLSTNSTTVIKATKNIIGRAVYRFLPAKLRSFMYAAVIEKVLAKK